MEIASVNSEALEFESLWVRRNHQKYYLKGRSPRRLLSSKQAELERVHLEKFCGNHLVLIVNSKLERNSE